MNNFYPGVDIVDVDRIKSSIEKYQDKFLSKVFNKEEQDYCNSKSKPFIHFSGKFAAKEAVMKAVFCSKKLSSISFKDISIINDKIYEVGTKKNLKIVDLTGAGDLFAAGFLHGYVNNLSIKESLEAGTTMSSKIIQIISGQSIRLVHIPFLQLILRTIANFLYVISLFGKFDFIITPNRVVKLFSDTSYTQINYEDIDTETYTSRNCRQLTEILADFKKEKINA